MEPPTPTIPVDINDVFILGLLGRIHPIVPQKVLLKALAHGRVAALLRLAEEAEVEPMSRERLRAGLERVHRAGHARLIFRSEREFDTARGEGHWRWRQDGVSAALAPAFRRLNATIRKDKASLTFA